MLNPTPEEQARRDAVMETVLRYIREDRTIKLPDFDPSLAQRSDYALLTVGLEDNPFSGVVGSYRYQFEGEEDLLHLIVTQADGHAITAEEGQGVAAFLMPQVSPAIMWLKPGEFSQHFYIGHDELLR